MKNRNCLNARHISKAMINAVNCLRTINRSRVKIKTRSIRLRRWSSEGERKRERKKKSNDSQTKTRLNLVENFENAAVKSTGSALKILEGRIRLSSRAILADLKPNDNLRIPVFIVSDHDGTIISANVLTDPTSTRNGSAAQDRSAAGVICFIRLALDGVEWRSGRRGVMYFISWWT